MQQREWVARAATRLRRVGRSLKVTCRVMESWMVLAGRWAGCACRRLRAHHRSASV